MYFLSPNCLRYYQIFVFLLIFSHKKIILLSEKIENAKFNKGKSKLYLGVAGNLMAFACKVSFEKGYDGYVSFISKSKLITHYEKTLGAIKIGGLKMIIDTQAARKLFLQYFKM
jgi:hypothetical protein